MRLSARLPEHGSFKAAMLDDDEYAERMGVQGDAGADRVAPSYRGYDPVLARLTDIADLLLSLRTTVVAVNSESGRAPSTRFMPRPETAFDRLERRRSRQQLDALSAVLTPGR
ncbi:hypothetical protein [Pseudonocardia sp. ICBG1142]|uniref:hypothetical protein n=2 Tax=Pseudonocardia sp. ICBG1142 TaxID=2846760 RepID=UPI001CF6422A|nr:hypothetical protein [Pseudonocardia sp. ICBG1142]